MGGKRWMGVTVLILLAAGWAAAQEQATERMILFTLQDGLVASGGLRVVQSLRDRLPPKGLPPDEEEVTENKEIVRLNQLGFLALRAGQIKQAAQEFRKAYALNPNNRRTRFGVGTALIALGRDTEALAVLVPMAKAHPEDYYIKNNIAWLLATSTNLSLRNSRRAFDVVRDALVIAPNDVQIWSTLAEIYYARGDYDKALELIDLTLDLAEDLKAPNLPVYRKQKAKYQQAEEAFTLVE